MAGEESSAAVSSSASKCSPRVTVQVFPLIPVRSMGSLSISSVSPTCAAIGGTLSRFPPAFDAGVTYDDLRRNDRGAADYYVEVISSRGGDHSVGGIGGGGGNIGIGVAVVVSRVAAELRLYDGRTLEQIDAIDLQKGRTGVVPASIGVGGRSFWAYIALLFMRYGEYRAAAHDVAEEAAERIAHR